MRCSKATPYRAFHFVNSAVAKLYFRDSAGSHCHSEGYVTYCRKHCGDARPEPPQFDPPNPGDRPGIFIGRATVRLLLQRRLASDHFRQTDGLASLRNVYFALVEPTFSIVRLSYFVPFSHQIAQDPSITGD
jgi:hypothetical protein